MSLRAHARPAGKDPVESTQSSNLSPLERAEWIVAVLLSAVVLFLLIARITHAGALWRDECDSVQLARMPTFSDVFENLQYTSFPILFPIVVRLYTTLFGTSDVALRCFGLAVGIFFLFAAWFHSRSVTREAPLLLPALIGLNATFLTAGTWLRGYGLGSVLLVLGFSLTAKFLLQPAAGRLIAASLVYIAGMHCLFFNGALVPAIVLAAAIGLLRRREVTRTFVFVAAAMLCGISYIPYLLKVYFRTSNWAKILQVPVRLDYVWREFSVACGGTHLFVSVAWLVVIFMSILGAGWQLKVVWRGERARERGLLLFGLLTIPAAVAAYWTFQHALRNPPQPRYYLALLCLVAVAADLIVSNLSRSHGIRIARLILVVGATLTLPFANWSKITERQTDIDTIVQKLEREAQPNDLIVVNRWSLGIAFNRYYRGPTRWITVPEMNEHRIHRYDLLQAKMTEFFPLDDVEREISTTSERGNRVWIVNEASFAPRGRAPIVLAPAPDPKFGWQSYVYSDAWSQQLAAFARRHAERAEVVIHQGRSVSSLENVWLVALQGWRY